MRHIPLAIAGAVLGLLFAACTVTDDTPPPPVKGIGQGLDTPETPSEERIAEVLQEAKQQYDDRQFPTALRLAMQAEQLIREHKVAEDARYTAVNIQGYSLLQLGNLDDYSIKNFGRQPGAATKFSLVLKEAPEEYPNNFRASLGLALVKFRRHGDNIRKAESLDQGILALAQIREDIQRALAGGADAAQRKREAVRRCLMFAGSRTRMIELGYIFRDPSAVEMDKDGNRSEAPWLGGLTQAEEELAIADVRWLLDDAMAGSAIAEADRKRGLEAADKMAESWRKVRKYWRVAALRDLQGARDDFLAITNKWPKYFWAQRDLTFIYQSLGGFFMDVGLEQARLQAIAAGRQDDTLEDEARRIYVSPGFESWEKTESARNYAVALQFTLAFVKSHRIFEMEREKKRDSANYDDVNENPFMVDLVQRYRQAMDELIAQERGMRAGMILEAAALCVDPLYQINDIAQAIVLAQDIKALAPSNPIHHFVRATAWYTDKQYDKALEAYRAFLKESSIASDARQRDITRKRMAECEQQIRRNPPEGGAGGNG